MKKFLLGILVGLVLSGLCLVILVFALARLGSARKPSVADGSILVLKLEGPIPERAPEEFPLPIFEQQSPATVQEVWDILRKAAVDARIKAVVLMPQQPGRRLGQATGDPRLSNAIPPVRQTASSPTSVLPARATTTWPRPPRRSTWLRRNLLDLKGLRAELTYFRNTLDKIGVQVEIVHAGKYKDFRRLLCADLHESGDARGDGLGPRRALRRADRQGGRGPEDVRGGSPRRHRMKGRFWPSRRPPASWWTRCSTRIRSSTSWSNGSGCRASRSSLTATT